MTLISTIKKHIHSLSEKYRRRRLPKEVQDRHAFADDLEKEMSKLPQIECPVEHMFTPGLYTRITTLLAGTILTSEIHKTEHPFFVMEGVVEVINVETGEKDLLEGPCFGVTKPYTRRVLNVLEKTIWATCHVTKETNVEKIGDKILVQRDDVISQYKNTKTLKS